jgi:hypothetical protein
MNSVRGRVHMAGEPHCRLSVTAALIIAGATVLMSSVVACGNGVSSALSTLPPTRATSSVPQAHSGNGASPAPNTPVQTSARSNAPLMGGDTSFPAPSASARGSVSAHSNGFDGPPAASSSPTDSGSPSTTSGANSHPNPTPSCSTTSSASPATTPPASSPTC